MRLELPNLRLIVTGDLTAWAHGIHFERFKEFVEGRGLRPGLGARDWQELTIIGNHDNWSGLPFPLGRRSPAGNLFVRDTLGDFSHVAHLSFGNGRRLTFLSIDTDFDVHPWLGWRLRAVGHFTSQLKKVRDQLAPEPEHGEVRVLLMHHSWGVHGMPWRLHISEPSLLDLGEFVDGWKIKIILSGHMHEPRPIVFRTPDGRAMLEGRCGTSAQLERLTAREIERRGTDDRLEDYGPNSVLVHQVREDAEGLHWSTSTFSRRAGGFLRGHHPALSATLDLR